MSGSSAPRIDCALDIAMSVIEGKWKAPILCKLLMKGDMRFNQLMKELSSISPRILSKQLKEMETDGLIKRVINPDSPSLVEYSITEKGRSLGPPLTMLTQWALDNMPFNMVKLPDDAIIPRRSGN